MAVRMITSNVGISHCVVSAMVGRSLLLTGVLLLSAEELGDLVANFAIGHLDIILGVTIVGHQGKEAIVRDVQL